MATVVPANFPNPDFHGRYQAIAEFLNRYCIERDEEIKLSLLAMIARVDLLFLGDPGVGKTMQIELLTEHCLAGGELFTHLCAKDQTVGEILGGTDVLALEQGRYARVMDGMLPKATVAYLDEIFKASPPFLNPLLDILANRRLKVAGVVHDCSQLVTIFMSSNELPDREDLMAFRDRIAVTKFVTPIITPEGRRAVSEMQLQTDVHGYDTTALQPLTLGEVSQIREQVKQVAVPDGIIDVMGQIEQRCLEAKHPISQRRKRDIWKMVKAHAWTRGSDTVGTEDFAISEHMLWNLASDVKSARKIVLEFANKFVQRAAEVEAALEPIVREMGTIKQKIEQATTEKDKLDAQDKGYDFSRDMKELASKAEVYIREGQREGQDVTPLKEALRKVQRAQRQTQDLILGTTDDDDEEDDL